MADDEQSTSGMVSGLAQVFAAQLRSVTEGLENLAGSGARIPAARSPFLLPGALSAAQVNSIADSVAAQRRSIEALKAQLSAFDEQLAVLEQILGPFAEWSRTWADLEEQLVTMRPRPEAEGCLPRNVHTVAASPGYRGPLPRVNTPEDTAPSKAEALSHEHTAYASAGCASAGLQ